jgi:hypothetical protein
VTNPTQILLGERAHLIEFPSVLLPPGAAAGSIVNISVQQNHAEEAKRDTAFWALQDDILDAFGRNTPAAPQLEVRVPVHHTARADARPCRSGT